MVILGDTLCAALDKGGGVRFGPDTFAIYSCAPLPPTFRHLEHNGALYARLTASASLICGTLPVYVNLEAPAVAQLASLPVPAPIPTPPARSAKAARHLPWFLINAATIEKHCVIGNGSVVEALLVILQRPWCVLEICCTDTETVVAVRKFAQLAAQEDPDSYDAAVRLLAHEQRMRSLSSKKPSSSHCSVKALRDIYAATTLTYSYNRFWLPLICTCGVYLDVSFSEVVKWVREDTYGPEAGNNRLDWIGLYGEVLRRIGDWVT
ncbi:uncharacterized protein BJX67DRAFT_263650 [Aspergillus lucknowensis]|uniref:Uncharacterized protein n=1 Tax=Aspergillus lucknowensis TaxID=176173 RepID=A0ABR4LFN1_9EURO